LPSRKPAVGVAEEEEEEAAAEEEEEAAEGVVRSWYPKGEAGSGSSWVQRQWLFVGPVFVGPVGPVFVGPVFVGPVPVRGVDATVEISENGFDESLSSLCVCACARARVRVSCVRACARI
jgi:hypothetical protein